MKLLILDANIVILLHEFGIWPRLLERCEVYLARTVAEDEAVFFEQDGDQQPIDLSDDISNNRVSLFDVSIPDIKRFLDQFDPVYISKLDPGETESLAFLTQSKESFLISSGDAIVFRVLGRLNRGDQGISLEEILNKIGLQQSKLPWSCQKTFREKYTSEGGQDMIQGKGLKQS